MQALGLVLNGVGLAAEHMAGSVAMREGWFGLARVSVGITWVRSGVMRSIGWNFVLGSRFVV